MSWHLWGVGSVFAVFGVLAVALVVQGGRLSAAREAAEAAEARAAGFEEAARIHRKHVVQLEAASVAAGLLDRELQEGEGADAPLSDYLVRGAGRVWP